MHIYGNGPAPGNQLAIIDMSRRAIARTIDLGEYRRPHDVAFLPGSSTKVLVTSEASQRVVVVDIATGTIEGTIETRAAASHMLALAADGRTLFSPDGKHALIPDPPGNRVHVVDVVTRRALGSIAASGSPRGVDIAADNRTVFITLGPEGEVVVADIVTRAVVGRHRVGSAPDGVGWGVTQS